MMRGMPRGSERTSTISPASTTTSVPAPIAIPTSAVARAGASFTSSPTIATTFFPCCWNSRTFEALSSGRTSANTVSTCSSAAAA
jgi:hypothetical protein